jgi:hypothetical protein
MVYAEYDAIIETIDGTLPRFHDVQQQVALRQALTMWASAITNATSDGHADLRLSCRRSPLFLNATTRSPLRAEKKKGGIIHSAEWQMLIIAAA